MGMSLPKAGRPQTRQRVAAAPGPPRRVIRRARINAVVSLASGILLWEFWGRYVYNNPLFFTTPSRVVVKLWAHVASGAIWGHLGISFLELGIGFGLAIVAGILIGIAMGMSQTVHEYLDPWVSALYSTPLVALTPFFILLFGVGVAAKAAVVFLVAVFPILINTYVGMRSVDERLLEVAHSFCATRGQLLREVLFPGAIPFIVTGIRLGAGRGLTGVVVAELFFSRKGIGFLISIGTQTFDIPQVFLGVIIFALSGVVITFLLRKLEQRLAPWRKVSL